MENIAQKLRYRDIAANIWKENAFCNDLQSVAELMQGENEALNTAIMNHFYPFAKPLHDALSRYSRIYPMVFGVCQQVYSQSHAVAVAKTVTVDYVALTADPEAKSYTPAYEIGTADEWMELCDVCWQVANGIFEGTEVISKFLKSYSGKGKPESFLADQFL